MYRKYKNKQLLTDSCYFCFFDFFKFSVIVGGKPVGASQLRDPYHHILNPPGITIGGWKLNKHGEHTELCRDLVSGGVEKNNENKQANTPDVLRYQLLSFIF